MNKVILFKDDNGDIQKAIGAEPVNRSDLVKQISETEAKLRELQDSLDTYDKLTKDNTNTAKLRSIEIGDGRLQFINGDSEPPITPIRPIQI